MKLSHQTTTMDRGSFFDIFANRTSFGDAFVPVQLKGQTREEWEEEKDDVTLLSRHMVQALSTSDVTASSFDSSTF